MQEHDDDGVLISVFLNYRLFLITRCVEIDLQI